MNEKERKWTIEGLTQLKSIMNYLIIGNSNVYIDNPQNFIKALDNALEVLGEGKNG